MKEKVELEFMNMIGRHSDITEGGDFLIHDLSPIIIDIQDYINKNYEPKMRAM